MHVPGRGCLPSRGLGNCTGAFQTLNGFSLTVHLEAWPNRLERTCLRVCLLSGEPGAVGECVRRRPRSNS